MLKKMLFWRGETIINGIPYFGILDELIRLTLVFICCIVLGVLLAACGISICKKKDEDIKIICGCINTIIFFNFALFIEFQQFFFTKISFEKYFIVCVIITITLGSVPLIIEKIQEHKKKMLLKS